MRGEKWNIRLLKQQESNLMNKLNMRSLDGMASNVELIGNLFTMLLPK